MFRYVIDQPLLDRSPAEMLAGAFLFAMAALPALTIAFAALR